MNYEIPDNEKANVLSVFWQMLLEIEGNTDPKRDVLNANLVKGAYNVLNRIGATQARPAWERKPDTKAACCVCGEPPVLRPYKPAAPPVRP